MNGSLLRLYVHERERHDGHPAWEWLLTHANKLGIRGGSAFKTAAGFGHHRHLPEHPLFDLVPFQSVEIEFVVSEH
jgi:PII-like signaling protein